MADPYVNKLVGHSFYSDKVEIKLSTIVVLDGLLDNRGLNLIQPISRAFPKYGIIELIGTDDNKAAPGGKVDNICYIGFMEMKNSGVLLTGDEVILHGKTIGVIAGYDDTHMPNHQNTLVLMEKRISGKDLGLRIGDELIIKRSSIK